jgi:hypothetical protein
VSSDNLFVEIVRAIEQRMLDTIDEPHGIFRLDEAKRGPCRRVLWIPTRFTQNPPAVAQKKCLGRRVLAAESWDVDCHITGSSFEDAECIRAAAMLATLQVLGQNSRATGGEWISQDANEAALTMGPFFRVLQRFAWQLNVLEPPGAMTKVTEIETRATVDVVDSATLTGTLVITK